MKIVFIQLRQVMIHNVFIRTLCVCKKKKLRGHLPPELIINPVHSQSSLADQTPRELTKALALRTRPRFFPWAPKKDLARSLQKDPASDSVSGKNQSHDMHSL